jgi:hypothetical protein
VAHKRVGAAQWIASSCARIPARSGSAHCRERETTQGGSGAAARSARERETTRVAVGCARSCAAPAPRRAHAAHHSAAGTAVMLPTVDRLSSGSPSVGGEAAAAHLHCARPRACCAPARPALARVRRTCAASSTHCPPACMTTAAASAGAGVWRQFFVRACA